MNHQQFKSGRLGAQLTQLQAADRLGLSQSYLSQLEKGQRLITPELRSWRPSSTGFLRPRCHCLMRRQMRTRPAPPGWRDSSQGLATPNSRICAPNGSIPPSGYCGLWCTMTLRFEAFHPNQL
jgi:Helix-turn-helix